MRTLLIVLAIILILAVVLVVVGRIFSGRVAKPADVGTGTLAPCPESPNCVSTLASDDLHQIEPIRLEQPSAGAIQALATIMGKMPKSKIVTQTDNYLHVELRSSFWNFIDDVEFLVDEEAGQIHSRSAARTGYSDLGVNKNRYHQISEEFSRFSP